MTEFDDILAALHKRYDDECDYSDSAYRVAALRVHYNLETEGPVSDLDRLFLAGTNDDAPDADILIERTLVEIRGRMRPT